MVPWSVPDRRVLRSTSPFHRLIVAVALGAAACSAAEDAEARRSPATPTQSDATSATSDPTMRPEPETTPRGHGIGPRSPIEHVVFIIKENRSFNHYFASYPGRPA